MLGGHQRSGLDLFYLGASSGQKARGKASHDA
jgi:hypothetical protein